jgi:hypothetical protein
MAADMSCTISLTFRPTITGSSNGVLTTTDLDGGDSQSVTLTGSGTQPSSASSNIALSSSVGSLQVTAAREAATSDVYITPRNGFQGQVSLQCKVVAGNQEGSTASPVCSLSTSQVTISDGNDSSSQLSVSTQTTGATSESGPLGSVWSITRRIEREVVLFGQLQMATSRECSVHEERLDTTCLPDVGMSAQGRGQATNTVT